MTIYRAIKDGRLTPLARQGTVQRDLGPGTGDPKRRSRCTRGWRGLPQRAPDLSKAVALKFLACLPNELLKLVKGNHQDQAKFISLALVDWKSGRNPDC